MEMLHFIFLVCPSSINFVRFAAQIVLVWPLVDLLALNLLWRELRRQAMVIRRENLRKRVPHLQLAIECAPEESLIRVKGAVTHCMLCSWRQ